MKCWGFGKRKSWLYWLLMLMMMVVLMVRQTQGGCIEEERNALLEIKASFMNTYGYATNHLLPTWVDNGSTIGGGECCDWERVKCNTTTGHVTMVALDNLHILQIDNPFYPGQAYLDEFNFWPLNVSIFHHFEDLRRLNLSLNFLDNRIVKTELEKLSSLKKLETLDLSQNYDIDNDVLPSLTTLTSLRNLDLSFTRLGGYFPTNGTFLFLQIFYLTYHICTYTYSKDTCILFTYVLEFAAMENLEMLDLYGCSFNGTFQMQGFERLPIMPKLKTLNLGYNQFNETVITSLSGFPLLETLDLSCNMLSRTFPAQELAQLTNLEKLVLSNNGLNDTSSIQDCKSLSRLKRLESLAIGNNDFNKSIIACLSALPSLKILDLSDSQSLGSSFPIQELSGLRNLKKLDLSWCWFDSIAMFNVPPYNMPTNLEVLLLTLNDFNGTSIEALASNFPHLEILDMSYNYQLAGSIPSEIRAFSSLRVLSLADNSLNGSLPEHAGLCELKNLEELDLRWNNFEGNLPQCLSNLSSLKRFDLSFNQFRGNIPSSLISNLTSLEYVDLKHNKFEGLFSMSSFINHTKLEVVEFISDNDKFEVETEEPLDWIPMFQLRVLALSNCNLNRPSSYFPSFLLRQHKLEAIDLSHNSLNGTFPNWLIENNTRLEYLILRNNSLGGTIHVSPPYLNFHTKWWDVSANHLTGTIPHDMGDILSYIAYLNLSRNCLDGALPLSMGNLSYIEMLDLSNNNLSGEVPERLLSHCRFLTVLQLSNNKLDGKVLSRKFGIGPLQVMLLDNNRFTGVLTNEINEDVQLNALDISGNFFSGVIPRWITNLTTLNALVIRNNSFEGQFPCGIASFSFLDMSHNSFSGSVPSCINLQGIKHLHLNSNNFSGSIPNAYRDLKYLSTLDMGKNKLSGTIPSFLGELSSLRVLFLRENNFRGSIPKQLCKLSNVSLMDLSSNSLSGSIPNCLQNIASPKDLAFIEVSDRISFRIEGDLFNATFEDYRSKAQNEFQFITKSRPDTYKGRILDYMSGLDLSCNNLTGEIPKELGWLINIHALNLSHNQLTGPIPTLFSNMENLESLDISSNSLSGNVPSELTRLHSLSTFIVANNNLSGRLPEMEAQFGTFDASSYEGNPFLCGPPLEMKCTPAKSNLTLIKPPLSAEQNEEKWYDVDMLFCGASLVSTWFVFLMGFAGILYVNPNWRRRWFAFIEQCMYTCYYFLCDSLRRRRF